MVRERQSVRPSAAIISTNQPADICHRIYNGLKLQLSNVIHSSQCQEAAQSDSHPTQSSKVTMSGYQADTDQTAHPGG